MTSASSCRLAGATEVPTGAVTSDRSPFSHRCHEVARSRAPSRDRSEGLCEGDVEDVHPFRGQNVDGSGERCRHRRNEDGEPAIVERLDDERRHERVLEFDQCRRPRSLLTISRQSLCQARSNP